MTYVYPNAERLFELAIDNYEDDEGMVGRECLNFGEALISGEKPFFAEHKDVTFKLVGRGVPDTIFNDLEEAIKVAYQNIDKVKLILIRTREHETGLPALKFDTCCAFMRSGGHYYRVVPISISRLRDFYTVLKPHLHQIPYTFVGLDPQRQKTIAS